ncbi:MAG TPA: GIY-YIG nuclease family protein [Friedmanniella sp.]
MAWTYLLRCSNGSFYVGSTRNLDQRVAEHDAGAVEGYTEKRRPVELVWAHETERVDEAWALERQIKGWGRAKRIALIEGRFADLPGLSRSRSGRGRTRPSADAP